MVLEHLRAQADMANRADAVARQRHRDPMTAPGYGLKGGEYLRIERADQRLALGGQTFQRRAELAQFRGERALFGLDGFLLGAELAFGFLQPHREVVAFEHPLEDRVFESLDFFLGELDLLLHRLIFDVGFHRHELVAEFREATLVDCDFFFNRALRSGSL